MPRIKVTKVVDNRQKLMDKLAEIKGQGVEVGYFPEQGYHPSAKGEGGNKLTYVELAHIHENGIGVTERPFMEQIWQLNMYRDNKVSKAIELNMLKFFKLEGPIKASTMLRRVGEAYMPNVNRVMGNPAYLAVTNNDEPLIDTEALARAFAYRDTITKKIKEQG